MSSEVPFAITPHPNAPLFNSQKDGQLLIKQLITEITSKHLVETNELKNMLQQVCLVNLWFFLKFICGYAGPYNLLNDTLHKEMANWRQSQACMRPGGRAAGFIFRSALKSTIWTHGANSWEIIRNYDIRIRLESGVYDKAEEFLGNIKNTFENNDLIKWLFPETVPPPGWDRLGNWSSKKIVCPARSKYSTEATVSLGSMTGASEGGHYNLYNCDDPVGLDDLDSQMSSSADMYRKKKRFITNKTALLDIATRDRVILVGTRYAVDDIYDVAINDAYEFLGHRVPEFKEAVNGEWSIYNRLAEEDGVFIHPEKVNAEVLAKAMEQDRWFAMTQLMNYPQKTGLSELNEFTAKSARVEWNDEFHDYVIRYMVDSNYDDEKDSIVPLSECDVVMSLDPAGTDKGISAKTSRSSLGVWARDYKDRVTRIYSRVGYYDINKMFDYIFDGHKRFSGYIRATIIESNAMQKVLLPLLRKEELNRGMYINSQGKQETQNKTIRIRNTLGVVLRKGKLYLAQGCDREFREELAIFPMNEYKMDVLDESEKGISSTYTPQSGEDRRFKDFTEDEMVALASDNVFGY